MSKSKKNIHPFNTGDDFISLAERRGAIIETKGNSGFIKIKTPKGSVFVAPGDKQLDKKTVSNLRKWFRLLGLMLFILYCIAIFVYPIITRL